MPAFFFAPVFLCAGFYFAPALPLRMRPCNPIANKVLEIGSGHWKSRPVLAMFQQQTIGVDPGARR
ncbi:MAG: hypothetical protein CFE29_07900 [Bradyrhizobiaceae bacterium PARB1]|jgi:hypothetical protein|nr:MAG: hypothetical protein CFE29_07900 [Bradyrhizobiaceae bacterium PARB1]